MDEPLDLERARLLLVWLQARRALDHALSESLAAGPAGERRVRARLDLIEELERKAHTAFHAYRASANGEHVRAADAPVTPLRRLRVSGSDPS